MTSSVLLNVAFVCNFAYLNYIMNFSKVNIRDLLRTTKFLILLVLTFSKKIKKPALPSVKLTRRADAIPKLYSWGVAPNPTLAVWQEGKACCLSLCEGSVSLRSVKGRVVFSAKISTLKPLTALSLYVSKNVEIYRLTGRSPSTVPRGGWGCRGQSPLHSPPSIKEPV